MAYEKEGRSQGGAQQVPRRSLRVTLTWDGKALAVRHITKVAMMAPASEATPPKQGAVGFWVELHDRKGRLLYCRVLRNPIATHVEVFSPNEIERIPVAPAPTEFDVIVPDYDEAGELVVWSSPLDFERALGTAGVLGKFDLTTGGRGGEGGKSHERI
jgi:hypothetical protein